MQLYLSTGEEKGLGGPLSVLADTAILYNKERIGPQLHELLSQHHIVITKKNV